MAPQLPASRLRALAGFNDRSSVTPEDTDIYLIEDDPEELQDFEEEEIVDQFPNFTSLFSIDDYDDLFETDQDGIPVVATASPTRSSQNVPSPDRNPSLRGTGILHRSMSSNLDGNRFEKLDDYEHNDILLKPDDSVKLLDGNFARIKHIIKDKGTLNQSKVILRGYLMNRSTQVPVADRHTNELTMYREYYKDDKRPEGEQGLTDFTPQEVLQKRKIIITTAPYPTFSCNAKYAKPISAALKTVIRETESLCCRFVTTQTFERSPSRLGKYRVKSKEGTIRKVVESEADIYGISCHARCVCHDKIDATQLAHGQISYGSAFCGAGGDIRGAKQAGAKLKFAYDFDPNAIIACRTNNPEAEDGIRQLENLEFLQRARIPVHIYHASFPCKSFSPKNHFKYTPKWHINSDLILSTREHLQKVRPLIHTQENTAGLIQLYPNYLWTPISDMIDLGYNVQWKIMQFQDHGLVASRKRLIIIAARHDIPLPDFPKEEYSSTGDAATRRKPYVTVAEALSTFNRSDREHRAQQKPFPERKPRYDPKTKLLPCIMAAREDQTNYHYSGKRPWTNKEIAHFQTFPQDYKFFGNQGQVISQIGNAVPPMIWKKVTKNIIKTLRKHGQSLMRDEDEEVRQMAERIRRSVALEGNLPLTPLQSDSSSTLGSGPSTPIVLEDSDVEIFVPQRSTLPCTRKNVTPSPDCIHRTPTKRTIESDKIDQETL